MKWRQTSGAMMRLTNLFLATALATATLLGMANLPEYPIRINSTELLPETAPVAAALAN